MEYLFSIDTIFTLQKNTAKTLDNSFSLSQNSTDLSNGEVLTNSSPTRPVSQSDGKTLDEASLSRCERTTRAGRKTKLPSFLQDYELRFVWQI